MACIPEPIHIAVFPRFSDATGVVCDLVQSWNAHTFAIAIAEGDSHAQRFRSTWPEVGAHPLLLLRCEEAESIVTLVDAIRVITSDKTRNPLVVLIADGPEASGFAEAKRATWNKEFAHEVANQILDVQVFEYSPTWANSPPRAR